MVLAFDNAGDFAKAVYGDASQQHAGTNNAIASVNPSLMKGGNSKKNDMKKGGKKNNSKKNNSKKRGGKNNSKRQNNSKR